MTSPLDLAEAALAGVRWTGPRPEDLRPDGYRLRAPVPPERWPYGPPSWHQACCRLHARGLYCDCEASAADDDVWGAQGWPRPGHIDDIFDRR